MGVLELVHHPMLSLSLAAVSWLKERTRDGGLVFAKSGFLDPFWVFGPGLDCFGRIS